MLHLGSKIISTGRKCSITVVKRHDQGKKISHHGIEMISRKKMFHHGSKIISRLKMFQHGSKIISTEGRKCHIMVLK